MGQSSSTSGSSILRREIDHKSVILTTPAMNLIIPNEEDDDRIHHDYTSDLPDECLAYVFQFLGSVDRNRCCLVSRRWLLVDGQSRHRLSLNARSDLTSSISSLFTRFDSVTKLALKCDRRIVSISDDDLIQISLRCRNLIRLKLRGCKGITDAGMLAFALNCKRLKKLSCGSCTFGAKGMNAVLDHCSFLEELSVKRLRGMANGAPPEPIGPGVAGRSLKFIYLKEIYNGQCFGPLIAGSKNLKTLKVFRCSGDWDTLFESISFTKMVEIHLERIQVSDRGLAAISKCVDLEILHLVKTPECTNVSLMSIAARCKLLRKLHIDGWKTNKIGDEGLSAIAKHCVNLQELVLISVNPTNSSLGLLGNCPKLERLAICGSETIGDSEISCIASKCAALRKFCIKSCPVSNHALEALAGGCPKLVKLKVKKCKEVTSDGVFWLRSLRQSLVVNLDVDAGKSLDASNTDGEKLVGAEDPRLLNQIISSTDVPSSSNARSSLSMARLGLLVGRNFTACTFRRWSSSNSSDGT